MPMSLSGNLEGKIAFAPERKIIIFFGPGSAAYTVNLVARSVCDLYLFSAGKEPDQVLIDIPVAVGQVEREALQVPFTVERIV